MSLEEDRDRYGYSKPHPWVEDQYLEDLDAADLTWTPGPITWRYLIVGDQMIPLDEDGRVEDGRQDVERDG